MHCDKKVFYFKYTESYKMNNVNFPLKIEGIFPVFLKYFMVLFIQLILSTEF